DNGCVSDALHFLQAQNLGAVDLGSGYRAKYFKHSRRPPDGLLIAVKSGAFKTSPEWILGEDQGFALGGRSKSRSFRFLLQGVDLEHQCGAKIRVVTGHMKGGRPAQLQAFAEFASAESSADVEILTADFNEDFAEQGRSEGIIRCPFGHKERHYSTLPRGADLPQLSRPPNKQAPYCLQLSTHKIKIFTLVISGSMMPLSRSLRDVQA
ncbi:Calm4, partial [Symbiodinium sp. CCMP2592]